VGCIFISTRRIIPSECIILRTLCIDKVKVTSKNKYELWRKVKVGPEIGESPENKGKYILNVETGGQRYSINLEEAQKEGRHNVTSFSTVFV
jgi:hypothetical protein